MRGCYNGCTMNVYGAIPEAPSYYPKKWPFLREAALLPSYDPRNSATITVLAPIPTDRAISTNHGITAEEKVKILCCSYPMTGPLR